MNPAIKQLDEFKVIGLATPFISIRSKDANNFDVIPKLWDDLIKRIREVPGRHEYISIGLCANLPDGIERTHPDELYYIAGFMVDSLDDIPEGMVGRVVPAATYAMFTHHGPIDQLRKTVDYIYGTWRPTAEVHPSAADQPDIEWYDQRFNPESDTSEIDIYIPVEGQRAEGKGQKE